MRATVPEALDGERVDRAVALLAGLTRSQAAALVAAGGVRVEGRPVTVRSHRLAAGDVIDVERAADVAPPTIATDSSVTLEVVHADDDVVVVDKPPGMVVHPGAGRAAGTLVHGLLARFPEIAGVGDPARPGIVHRLDKGTSGLLVVARTSRAHEALVAQLSSRTVAREYAALVWGAPEARTGMVDAPIGRSAREPTRMAVSARGREARTRYDVERTFTDPAEASLLGCRLETGRTHQIRVHLAAIGHPVVGDGRYGGDRPPLRPGRPLLHARRLAFAHPATGETVEFRSALARDFEEVLAALG